MSEESKFLKLNIANLTKLLAYWQKEKAKAEESLPNWKGSIRKVQEASIEQYDRNIKKIEKELAELRARLSACEPIE